MFLSFLWSILFRKSLLSLVCLDTCFLCFPPGISWLLKISATVSASWESLGQAQRIAWDGLGPLGIFWNCLDMSAID
jgi:hypothetical protein